MVGEGKGTTSFLQQGCIIGKFATDTPPLFPQIDMRNNRNKTIEKAPEKIDFSRAGRRRSLCGSLS
jgi:hypothetical protein